MFRNRPIPVLVGLWVLLPGWSLVSGCGPKPNPSPAPTTQPAADSAPATQPSVPAKATLALDEIKPAVAKPTNPPDVRKLSNRAKEDAVQGEKLLARRDYAAALVHLERAVGFEPNNPRIRRALGLTYIGLANRGKAIESLRRAAKVAPDDLEVQLLLAKLALDQKQTLPATRRLRLALKCSEAKPGNSLAAEALLHLGDQLKAQGYWQAALECYTRLSDQLDEHGRRYMLRAKLKPLVLRPERLTARRGELLLRLRKPVEAAKLLERAYRRDRTDPAKAELLVRALVAAEQYAHAEQIIGEMAAEPALRSRISTLAVLLCRASNDKAAPGRIWRAYRKKHPVNVGIAAALAKAAQQLGSLKDAIEILEAVLAARPGDPTVVRAMSALYVRQGRFEKALRAWAGLLEANPSAVTGVRDGIQAVAAAAKPKDLDRRFAEAVGKQKSPALFYVAGQFARARRNQQLAEEQFNRAIEADGKYLPAFEAILEIRLAESDSKKVEAFLSRLEKAIPQSHLAWYARGKLKLAGGEVAGAVEALEKAREIDKTHLPTMLALAQAYARAGRPLDAERALKDALDLVPQRVEVYERLFAQSLARGRLAQAQWALDRLRKQQPGSLVVKRFKAELALARGRRDEARKLVAELTKQAGKDIHVRVLALRLEIDLRTGPLPKAEYDRALGRAEKLLTEAHENPAVRSLLTKLLLAAGERDSDRILQAWKRLYERASDDLTLTRRYVAVLLEANQHAEALAVVQALLKGSPDDFWARRRLLDALEALKRADEAIGKLRTWLKTQKEPSGQFWYRLRLLKLYEDSKKFEPAQKLLDEWIGSARGPALIASLRDSKLSLYGAAKQYDKAVEYAGAQAKEADDPDAIRQRLVLVLVDGERLDQAGKLLDEWLKDVEEKKAPRYRLLKLHVLAKAGKLAEVQKFGRAWVKRSPKSAMAREALVEVLSATAKRRDLALAQIDAWLKAFGAGGPATTRPKPPKPQPAPKPAARLTLDKETLAIVRWCQETAVRLLLIQDKNAAALARTQTYLRIELKASEPTEDEPLNAKRHRAELLNLEASCLTELGRNEESLAALEKALALLPEDAGNNNNLGYMYADLGLKLERAERMIRKALTERKEELAYKDSLGWVLYKQGHLRQAAAEFAEIVRRSQEEQSGHPVMFDHAGDVFYRLGWKNRAVALWTRAVELATKEKRDTLEIRLIRDHTPGKIEAAAKGREPKVAPLGKGVDAPKMKE